MNENAISFCPFVLRKLRHLDLMLITWIAMYETYPCSRIMATRDFEVMVRRFMREEKEGRRVSVGLKVKL